MRPRSGSGGGPLRRYARLRIGDDQPDGPINLVAMERDHPTWTEPQAEEPVYLSVWTVSEEDARELRGTEMPYEPPRQNPDARCDLVATEAEAQGIYRGHPDA